MGVYTKLLNIQQGITAIVKDSTGNNYGYQSGTAVLTVIRPLMNDNNVLLKQELIEQEHELITYSVGRGDEKRDKTEIMSYCKFRFTWVDAETGEKDENIFMANGMNAWDKGIGSAMTYAERYFLLKFFHVPTDCDDPDSRQDSKLATQTTTVKPINWKTMTQAQRLLWEKNNTK